MGSCCRQAVFLTRWQLFERYWEKMAHFPLTLLTINCLENNDLHAVGKIHWNTMFLIPWYHNNDDRLVMTLCHPSVHPSIHPSIHPSWHILFAPSHTNRWTIRITLVLSVPVKVTALVTLICWQIWKPKNGWVKANNMKNICSFLFIDITLILLPLSSIDLFTWPSICLTIHLNCSLFSPPHRQMDALNSFRKWYMSILLDGLPVLDKAYWLRTIIAPTESRTTSNISALWLATSIPTLTTKAWGKINQSFKHTSTEKKSPIFSSPYKSLLSSHMVGTYAGYFSCLSEMNSTQNPKLLKLKNFM